jgi:hypothetical protein
MFDCALQSKHAGQFVATLGAFQRLESEAMRLRPRRSAVTRRTSAGTRTAVVAKTVSSSFYKRWMIFQTMNGKDTAAPASHEPRKARCHCFLRCGGQPWKRASTVSRISPAEDRPWLKRHIPRRLTGIANNSRAGSARAIARRPPRERQARGAAI